MGRDEIAASVILGKRRKKLVENNVLTRRNALAFGFARTGRSRVLANELSGLGSDTVFQSVARCADVASQRYSNFGETPSRVLRSIFLFSRLETSFHRKSSLRTVGSVRYLGAMSRASRPRHTATNFSAKTWVIGSSGRVTHVPIPRSEVKRLRPHVCTQF